MNAPYAMSKGRSEERTHLFLDATWAGEAGRGAQPTAIPVRVRNLSATGALIEGVMLPLAGAQVTLRRGECEATGRTMWVAPGRCGLEFDAPIRVASWLPARNAPRHTGVDHARQVPRTQLGTMREAGGDMPSLPVPTSLTKAQALAELVTVQGDLATLRDRLASGCDVSENKTKLSVIGNAADRIERIISTLRRE